jgi:hypothetical protein
MPPRSKPMKRGTSELARSGPIARKTPMPSPRIPAPRPASDPQAPPKAKPAPSGQQQRAAVREAARRRAKAAAKKRASGACEHCGESTVGRATHGHHRDPQGMGGTFDPGAQSVANFLHILASCHAWIETQARETALAAGWLVEAGGDPASTPVRYRGGPWVLLDADGGVVEMDAAGDDARLLAVEVAARQHRPFSVP